MRCVKTKLAQKKNFVPLFLGLIFLFTLFSPLHEFGHLLIATLDGAQIHSVAWFPYIDETGIHSANINVNEFTFSSILILIFFEFAGLLITFTPFPLLFIYLHHRKSAWWTFVFIQVMASFAVASNDLLNVGRILQNSSLGIGLCIVSFTITVGLFTWFAPRIKQLMRTQICRSIAAIEV